MIVIGRDPELTVKQKCVQSGRPTKYSEKLAEEICTRLRMGETLIDICRHKHMPARQKVYEWQAHYPAFGDAFARARVEQMQAWADEIITLADDSISDFKIILDTSKGAVAQFDRTHVQRAKLQIRTRQWLMERIAPALFRAHQAVDPARHYAELDDQELIRNLRQSFNRTGFTADELLEIVGLNRSGFPGDR